MNRYQRLTLLIVLAIVFGMLLFPPFRLQWVNGQIVNLGYGFLLYPPKIGPGVVGSGLQGGVDVGLLITQWLGVLIMGGVIFFLLKDK